MLSRAVALLACVDMVVSACTPTTSRVTIDGTAQTILIGTANVINAGKTASAVTEGSIHCAKICTDTTCKTLAGPAPRSYMCCNAAFQPRCDGTSQCGTTLATDGNGRPTDPRRFTAGPPNPATCRLTAGNNGAPAATMPACGLDEENCGGLRGTLKNGAFSSVTIPKTGTPTYSITQLVTDEPMTVGQTATFNVGGQVMSDFTSQMCLEEPTYEDAHTIVFDNFNFEDDTSSSSALAMNALQPGFATKSKPASDQPCKIPCPLATGNNRRTCTDMSTSAGTAKCGSVSVDTELGLVIDYKPPQNFLGNVTFSYRVSTEGTAVQKADTGFLPVSMTFVAPACSGDTAGYCGENGKCTTRGCDCIGSFTGNKCQTSTSKIGIGSRSWGGTTVLVVSLLGGIGLGGFCLYTNKAEMFKVDEATSVEKQTESMLHMPPTIPAHHSQGSLLPQQENNAARARSMTPAPKKMIQMTTPTAI